MSRIYNINYTKLWSDFILLFVLCITTLIHGNNQVFEYKDHLKNKFTGQIQRPCVLFSYRIFFDWLWKLCLISWWYTSLNLPCIFVIKSFRETADRNICLKLSWYKWLATHFYAFKKDIKHSWWLKFFDNFRESTWWKLFWNIINIFAIFGRFCWTFFSVSS